MSNPRRFRDDDRPTDALTSRSRRTSDDTLVTDLTAVDEMDGTEAERRVAGHALRIDDTLALIERSLDYDAAEWLLRRVAAPTVDVLH